MEIWKIQNLLGICENFLKSYRMSQEMSETVETSTPDVEITSGQPREHFPESLGNLYVGIFIKK